MALKPLAPGSDPRVSSQYAVLNGNRCHYLLGVPEGGKHKATVVLVHGWPDISFGWRYQIPTLLQLGLRIVAPDLIGFGQTDAPQAPPESLDVYSIKRACDNIAELAYQLGESRIILGGHDWGGMVAWRCCQYHPSLISHVFVACTPYAPPATEVRTLQGLIELLPFFGYQAQLAGPDVEAAVKTRSQIKAFLSGLYGAKAVDDGKGVFSPERGFRLEKLGEVGETALLTKGEMDYYVEEYARNGMHGTLNWYRTQEVNSRDEMAISKSPAIDISALFICATEDFVLKPELAGSMDYYLSKLTRRDVAASHWILWEKPKEVNAHLEEWVKGVVFGGSSKL